MKYNQNYKKGDKISDYYEEPSQPIPNPLPPVSMPLSSSTAGAEVVSKEAEPISQTASASGTVTHRKKAAKVSTIIDPRNARIESAKQLRNIYDEGWWGNLCSIIFPKHQKQLQN